MQRSSSLLRGFLLVYIGLIIYASWYPLSGWVSMGIGPFDFLRAAILPRYWTWFDLFTNILAYVPLGFLLVLGFYPRLCGVWSVFVACIGGGLLSLVMEVGQTYLATRVAEIFDVFVNVFGTLVGALLGALTSELILKRSRLRILYRAWMVENPNALVLILVTWPLTQIYPHFYLFGTGHVLPVISKWASSFLGAPIDFTFMLRRLVHLGEPSLQDYWISETLITACGLCVAVLCLLYSFRSASPRCGLAIFYISAGLLIKAFASEVLFSSEFTFIWLTLAAQMGIVIGILVSVGLAYASPTLQRRLAIGFLLIGILLINLTPSNPYWEVHMQSWAQGKFLNFNGVVRFLGMIWPFWVFYVLLRCRRSRIT